MARRCQRALSRNGAGDQGPSELRVAMAGADELPLHGSDSQADLDELEIEDDDDIREDAAALFGIDVSDGNVHNNVVDVDADDAGGGGPVAAAGACSIDTHGISSSGKRKFSVWADFKEVKKNNVRVAAICKMYSKRLSARSCAGTGHLIRHHAFCRKKTDHAHRVQSRLALRRDGFHNWVYNPDVARTELCRLIARLDLPLGIGDTQAWEDYITRARNPRFAKVSRQSTTRDLGRLFAERRDVLMKSVLLASSYLNELMAVEPFEI